MTDPALESPDKRIERFAASMSYEILCTLEEDPDAPRETKLKAIYADLLHFVNLVKGVL